MPNWVISGAATFSNGSFRPTSLNTLVEALRSNPNDADIEMQGVFRRGAAAGGETSLTLKALSDNSELIVKYDGANVKICKVSSGGTVTDLATTAAANFSNKPFYLHARVIGNEVRGEVGINDNFEKPDYPTITNSLYEVIHTLTSTDASTWGSGVKAYRSGIRINANNSLVRCELLRMSPKREREVFLRARKIDKIGIKEAQDTSDMDRDLLLAVRASYPKFEGTLARFASLSLGLSSYTDVWHPGTAEADVVLRLYGPGNIWSIWNDTNATQMILFASIAANTHYVIDSRNRKIMKSDGTTPLAAFGITTPDSGYIMDWPRLAAGGSAYRINVLSNASIAGGTGARIYWRDAY